MEWWRWAALSIAGCHLNLPPVYCQLSIADRFPWQRPLPLVTLHDKHDCILFPWFFGYRHDHLQCWFAVAQLSPRLNSLPLPPSLILYHERITEIELFVAIFMMLIICVCYRQDFYFPLSTLIENIAVRKLTRARLASVVTTSLLAAVNFQSV